jgi:hypothetical protein
MALHGFDPLGPLDQKSVSRIAGHSIEEQAVKGAIGNILKSYTGYYDLFSEAIQNALDATQKKWQTTEGPDYKAKIWIRVSIQEGIVRVIDNGVGMTEEEFRLCFRPNVSFKRRDSLRGSKGVGATFLAYGFNYVHLQTKHPDLKVSGVLRNGRQWAQDNSDKIHRPRFEKDDFDVPELENEASGTAIEIRLTGQKGEKPKDLGWHGATTAKAWFDVLRLVTPLGGTYLKTPPFTPKVRLSVVDRSGTSTEHSSDHAEYFYPHEIPNLKVMDLTNLRAAIADLEGDPATRDKKLQGKYKQLECLYDIWTHDQLLGEQSPISKSLSEDEQALIELHQVSVYAAHLNSIKTFDAFNEDLGLRDGAAVMGGGLQLASDYMPQGPKIVIPLNRYTGYQKNTHVIVHFVHGAPDMGRKVFQPEMTRLAEQLAVDVTNIFIQYRGLMKSDTGATKDLTPDKKLYEWKKQQEDWRNKNGLPSHEDLSNVTYLSEPQQEQDVIALYHQLIGMGTVKGIRFFGSSLNDTYDALFQFSYSSTDLFDEDHNPLGVRSDLDAYESEPKVLEYKYDFDSLIQDIEKGIKFSEHIDLVVCWTAGKMYEERFAFQPLLIDGSGSNRTYFGSTHKAYPHGSGNSTFEVVVLADLIAFILDPAEALAQQRVRYEGN